MNLLKALIFSAILFLVMFGVADAATNVVRAKQLLDPESGATINDPVIVIGDGVILEVGNRVNVKIPEGAQVMDLGDSMILPGLIDAHVHLAWKGTGELPGREEASKTLLAGFTTVRNPGSTGKTDILLRNAIDSGQTAGPRMLIAGPALGTKGGVCDQVFEGEAVVATPEEAKVMVGRLVETGVNFIKFCAGGGVIPSKDDEQTAEMNESVMRAIVEEAHRRKVRVAAHAQGPAAILRAVRAGVDSIEHGGLIDEEAARLMKEKRVFLVPTLYRFEHILSNAEKQGIDPKNLEKMRSNWSLVQEKFRRAVSVGIPLAFGTDATVYPHGLNAREFAVLVRLGVTPLEAIRSATVYAAELLGMKGKIGVIRSGASADLIAVKGNPLENITILEKVTFVMKAGRIERSFR